MAQNNITVPNGSGLDVRTGFNNAILSLLTSFSGATDPSTLSPSCAVNFMKWIDTANKLVKTRNASNDAWLTKGALLDDGSEINYETVSTLASAATVNIGAANTNTVNITGTTTITAFDTAPAGVKRTLVFKDALTVTYAASAIILPTGANVTVAAGDIMEFISEGSGVWRCTNYLPAAGYAVDLSLYAKLASPSFTGTPTAPTAELGTNTTQIATMAAVMAGLKSIVTAADVTWSTGGKTFSCPSLGIAGLMDTNGYISFGKLFGGLILQWGNDTACKAISYPISFSEVPKVIAIPIGTASSLSCFIESILTTSFTPHISSTVDGTHRSGYPLNYVAIGK